MGNKTSLGLKIFFASIFTMLLTTFLFTSDISLSDDTDTASSGSETAGALTGTADGHNGPVTVSVTQEGDQITAVEVVEHEESPGYSDRALEDIPTAIVEANGTEGVEVVSGASVTSTAILIAVDNALAGEGTSSEGSGDTVTATAEGHNGPVTVDVTFDGDTITAVEVVEHEESEGYSDKALEDIPTAIVEANGTEGVEVVSGASVTSEAILTAVNTALDERGIVVAPVAETSESESEESKETSESSASEEESTESLESDERDTGGGGVLEGTAEGHNGPIKVEVSVEDDKITDVKVIDHEESDGYSDKALEDIPAAIVKENGTDVEVVSGATKTSEGIINAVEDALAADDKAEKDSTAAGATTLDDATVEVDGDKVTVEIEGHNGPLTIAVTFDGDDIKDVEIVEHEESKGYSDKAIKDIPKAIVDKNSADVEVISGASVTSQAIIDAVELAIEARK
ncbi:FMN-binding protein [Aerococcaceae bacterium DSM 111020]|nr:FMN-binding protein [Aerococcaceae bacterium DSM 111020]